MVFQQQLQVKIKALEAENARLKGIHTEITMQNVDLTAKNATLVKENDCLKKENATLKKQSDNAKASNFNMQLKFEKEKAKSAEFRTAANAATNGLKIQRFKKPKITKAEVKKKLHEVLSPFFYPAQINWFLSKGKGAHGYNWSKEELTLALTLMTMNKRTYNYLRSRKLIPLPGVTTLRKHFTTVL